MKLSKLFLLLNLFIISSLSYAQVSPQPAASGIKIIFEKTYLFTDRDYYAAGDDIWYSAFLMNGQTNLLTANSNNLYVEIIAPNSKLIERKLIRLDNGIGKGDFKLGDSIAPGKYRLRAYTNWMRNFDNTFFFEKEFTVLNPVATAPVSTSAKKAQTAHITFFPEGGSMIQGVSGIVAFKAEDALGKGVPVTGNIESTDGIIITALTTSFDGMGRFLLQPEAGKTYRARGNYSNGEAFNINLPAPLTTGFGLYVRQSDSVFTVNIKTNEATFNALPVKELSVILRNKGRVYSSFKLPLTAIQTSFQLPKAGIPAGISSLTIYDLENRPYCERLINVEDQNPSRITITPGKVAYRSKEKAVINLKTSDANGNGVKANVAMAVVDASLIPADIGANIVSYLNLQSELKGSIENPNQYFNPENESRNSQLDLLLLCSGWRDFIWKHLAEKPISITYNPEQGITIKGSVLEKFGGNPIANSNITLSAFTARGDKMFMTQSDARGKFYVDGVNFFGYQPVKITSVNAGAKKQGFLSVDTLSNDQYPAIKIKPFAIDTANYSNMLTEISRRQKFELRKNLSDTISLNEVAIKAQRSVVLRDVILNDFGYKEDEFTIAASDYDYTDLRHFLTHRLNYNTVIVNPGIRTNRETGETAVTPVYPRLIVNGREMPYTDQDPPELIQDYIDVYYGLRMDKVKYVKAKRMVGMDQNTGQSKEVFVLYLTVDMNAIHGQEVGVINREVQGYYESRVFYEPKYNTLNTQTDVRTTIHWQPNITTNANGEATVSYFNADPKSKIRIIAEGITDKGQPVAGTALYEVK